MNIIRKIKFAGALTILGSTLMLHQVSAREILGKVAPKPSQLKTTAATCQGAVAAIDLDINNVRARLMTGGDMWWNIGLQVAAYEVPKGSGKSSQFAASCWIGGYDKQGQLKVAAQTYRQDGNDYWPGALDNKGTITTEECANWDRFWKVDKSTINKFIELAKTGGNLKTAEFDVINGWPATGNSNVKGATGANLSLNNSFTYAPFVDLNGNGSYEPENGEYPDIRGDQFIWWVCNDAGNVKNQTRTASIGIEVQNSAFAYSTQDFLNNATFCNYRVINKGALTVDSTYIAVWDDCDLGYYNDDYIGCDTARGLGIMYTGASSDGQVSNFPPNSYGANPPQVGVDFFQGPIRVVKRAGLPDTLERLKMTNFTYYNNDFGIIGNPSNGLEIYRYMTGSIRNGDRFTNDFQGAGVRSKGYGSGPVTNFVFTGDPGDNNTWSECASGNAAGDRRFIFSSGPFQLLPGAKNDIVFGSVWASGVGGCPNTDFKTIKNIDDGAQALFDAGFKTVEGPESPRLVVRELDKKLVFYIVNDYGSNNYKENYGRDDGSYKDSLRYHQLVTKAKDISDDTLYKFEGYRVFQLANSEVTSADIFDPNTGEVNTSKAIEIFQCDKSNGITKIVNYNKLTSVSDSTWIPQIKVIGKDSGITHSFAITQDQFTATNDKNLVNYHNYYFVAIAYAQNEFAHFDPLHYISTQDKPYIGSSKGAGGINIPIVVATPNTSNGNLGTILNSDYGSGIVVTRLNGVGNGGNALDIDDVSRAAILVQDSLNEITYQQDKGPVVIKVVDPVKVPAYDWTFQLNGNLASLSTLVPSVRYNAKTSGWRLTATENGKVVETIYSERDISEVNEQILEKYGLSVKVKQVLPPSENQKAGNGLITSSITFEDPSKPWLFGVPDQSDSNNLNWIRAGINNTFGVNGNCNYNASAPFLDSFSNYTTLLSNYTPATGTWGPYQLGATWDDRKGTGTECGFVVAYNRFNGQRSFVNLNDVDIVMTSNRNEWTKCAVIEMQEDTMLAERRAEKFLLRRHSGWTGECRADGAPIYSTDPKDDGTSWFPGYAIDMNTGKRLNMVFSEDSYLSLDNGNDMIWNPSWRIFNFFDASIIFGGKHFVYVSATKYDSCKNFITKVKEASISPSKISLLKLVYDNFRWVGMPLNTALIPMKSAKDGLIPTKTTIKFRVNRPFAPFYATDSSDSRVAGMVDTGKATWPIYTFSTKKLAPTPLGDGTDKDAFLTKINVVPNPYYGYSGYEGSRFDTRVKIINVPAKVTVHIYSLDGTLIRTLSKSDPSTASIDWDVRNNAGLPIASGMYIMHVKAEGIGETVLKWFGAMRPIDATTY